MAVIGVLGRLAVEMVVVAVVLEGEYRENAENL